MEFNQILKKMEGNAIKLALQSGKAYEIEVTLHQVFIDGSFVASHEDVNKQLQEIYGWSNQQYYEELEIALANCEVNGYLYDALATLFIRQQAIIHFRQSIVGFQYTGDDIRIFKDVKTNAPMPIYWPDAFTEQEIDYINYFYPKGEH